MSHTPTRPSDPTDPAFRHTPPGEGRSPDRGHPPGLYLLFITEMWERFSYYGMRALLVLYLTAVIAAHELAPGRYTNELRFTEVPQVQGRDQAPAILDGQPFRNFQSLSVHVVVGDEAGPASEPPKPTGQPALRVQRLKQVASPTDPQKLEWVLDEAPVAAAVVVQPGVKPKDVAIGYRLSNPTNQPIKAVVEIARADPKDRTYFTVNDNAGSVSMVLKPDAERTEKDAPADVIVAVNTHESGRNWSKASASTLYGWYTGLAYLFPILGGLIADKLIGTHRSMLVGGVLISIGHVILGLSGLGSLAHNDLGMATFITGLVVIVLGTGHFKPTVSVMVGQLYPPGDPRRDGAFTIFYMGINLGAFICAFVCGTLGEKVGWHYGFGSAAVGMLLGLGVYLVGKPRYLAGIGDAPRPNAGRNSLFFFVGALAFSLLFGAMYAAGVVSQIGHAIEYLQANPTLGWAVVILLVAAVLIWATTFVLQNRPEDRGPVITIFVFMIFNAFFWIAFEQAGTSLNLFTAENTDRHIGSFEVPATWFQSVNAGLIFMLAPLFAGIWTALGKRRMNPSQPVKIALGLLFLGLGYIFMVIAGRIAAEPGVKASMMFIVLTYFWHTVGELCLSPTGLSYVTKAAPVRFVSLLMGIWFVSSFIANLGGGLVAAQVEAIERGDLRLPWNFGGQADFFFLFVVSSGGAGILILLLTPMLKKLMRNPTD